MNYLAHAWLSFHDPEVLTGNMISDWVKGKKKLDYPSPIRDGIALHRAIDGFTDEHPVTREAKEFFRPAYRLYSGPLVDVVYDHFLATDAREFENAGALVLFAKQTYANLGLNRSWFPERFAKMFPYMESQDWLSGYREKEGIYMSMTGLTRRARYMPGPEAAWEVFQKEYAALGHCYEAFFEEVKDFAWRRLGEMREMRGLE